MKIKDVIGKEILDSKGDPTIEVLLTLENDLSVVSKAPSGASTGTTEAHELRDDDPGRFRGRGVLKAVNNINTTIKKLLLGKDPVNQKAIDQLLIEADGTANKSHLGANALVAVSMAVCRAGAAAQKLPLYQHIGQLIGNNKFTLPEPLILILEGGKHGDWATDVQEYFVIPNKKKFSTFKERFNVGTKIFNQLQKILSQENYNTKVGFEGAFCPKEIKSNEEAFQLLVEASTRAGYQCGQDINLGIDAAASEFFINGQYVLKSENNLSLKANQWTDKLIDWTKKYPIIYLEDIFDEQDWPSWINLVNKIGTNYEIVGDDLLTTNTKLIQRAIETKAVNSVLIKPNQIGTITETLAAVKLAQSANFGIIISHRAGETNDDFIADLAVGVGAQRCKFGGPTKAERVAKYNRLLAIEQELDGKAK